MPNKTTREIGQYRPAHRVREGWQIRFLDNETNAESWLTVTHILRIYAPLNMVRFTFGDEGGGGVAHDTEVFCRTTAEVQKAGATS